MAKRKAQRGLLGPIKNLGFPSPEPILSDGRDDLIETQGRYIEILEKMGATDRAAATYAVGKLAAQKDNRRSGGRATGDRRRKDAETWHQAAIKSAERLAESGKKPHELTAIVARRLGKSADVVRPVLQAAGLVRKRRTS